MYKNTIFLVINSILASYKSFRFRNNLIEKIEKLIMTVDEEIRDEKLHALSQI